MEIRGIFGGSDAVPLRVDQNSFMLGTGDLAASNKTGLKFLTFDIALFLLLSGNISGLTATSSRVSTLRRVTLAPFFIPDFIVVIVAWLVAKFPAQRMIIYRPPSTVDTEVEHFAIGEHLIVADIVE